jgi:hypothetical protein
MSDYITWFEERYDLQWEDDERGSIYLSRGD